MSVFSFTLNGTAVEASPATGERLSQTLREALGARDVKIGCNAGDCGACTVLLDGQPVCACLTATQQVIGKNVETLAGLHIADPVAHRLAEQFQDHGAAQCGICTPGMMVAAVALLRADPQPSEEAVKDALGGVLCRCTGYRKIIDAVMGRPAVLRDDAGIVGVVGDSIRRLDGADKVAGVERFSDDIAPVGTLEVLVIRAPFARAGFQFGDLEDWAVATDGVEAVLTAQDVPGRNVFGVIPQFVDQPVFAEAETRFRGEAVAAVVGTPAAIKALAPDDFPVTWIELPAATDIHTAQDAQTSPLHRDRTGNVMCGGFVQCGDAKAALERAEFVVEGHFNSGFVEHAYIEPEAGFAQMVGDRVEIYAGTQAPVMDRDSLEIILGLDASKIRIVPTGTGGGFGSKLDLSVQPYLALAAMKAGKPVRLTYSRTESMQSTTKRHPSDIHLRIGANESGKICGFDFHGAFDTGAYASWGPTVANRVPVHASGPYQITDYRAESTGIHTNNPPAGAFRGFGVPQSAIAQESLFDVLAEKLGMDPLEFRILNALENDTPTVCGQVFAQGVGIRKCLESLRPAWKTARAAAAAFNAGSDTRKRGVGIAAGWYGCGNTSLPNPSTIKSGIMPDGTVVLHQGAMDIGQGANTVIAQIFATALGVAPASLRLIGPDTDVTPDAGKTSASRQTYVSGAAARLSGLALRDLVLKRMNVSQGAVLSFGNGQVVAQDAGKTHQMDLAGLAAAADGFVFRAVETYDPPTKPLDADGQGAPYAQFGYAAHLVEVEVDTKLGTVKPLNFTAAHDVGQAINPLLIEGQVQGGIAQGLGMALMEEYLPGRTENLHDYLIPTIGDMPPVETIIIEEPDAHGPYGAKGLGEHVLIPTAPAILNAIYAATGARITQVPATPASVYAAIKKAQP
ncbi:molybdopterin-dependent oxidoreductase [Sulfitobacter sp. M57]|uniref:molybdopterin-dependent oxidoreductase n=1 Tax=unclassified Sulfitobacter TaxID=196795 RepID=UPI0023E103C7|nr:MULTISPECIES: molybdopterin cofactor-binding domain-containing protein [unclassified Sulfitobacter]MDF3413758.1 molybdopterin-dependent oxidoreductase [Sulfitobacter sp. KE5]MDF3420961.1 molybdopterin-dependent oxidoreductase [Sulfitobacter sp. KE43]MDF3432304.1 molybdopterin-dependent oxidoreductase [Sulfitobacter sp. KE42]MDF3457943.1 molybdopterin-dependent oxidoreductase [Sulfitobacter sp. S74]MDF3461844.1 molybdopterin-dependent oxidoreductase [Sulfitobacter sp. Ks18]